MSHKRAYQIKAYRRILAKKGPAEAHNLASTHAQLLVDLQDACLPVTPGDYVPDVDLIEDLAYAAKRYLLARQRRQYVADHPIQRP